MANPVLRPPFDAFVGINLIPYLSSLNDFANLPPAARPGLISDNGRAAFSSNFTFQDFKLSLHKHTVWKMDANRIIEFSPKIKIMFLKVASIVAGIHLRGECAGDLLHRIRIYGDLSVNFPFPNKPTDGNTTLDQGIETDLLHFRRMVAEVIIATVTNYDVQIPFYMKLFFSEIFLQHPKKYAYLQLMHPILYDSNQRMGFFQLSKEYGEENTVATYALHHLHKTQFPFRGWSRRLPGKPSSVQRALFYSVYNYHRSTYAGGVSRTLPIYMRNLQYHCRHFNSMNPTHEEMDSLLHEAFPGVAEAVVDCHIRGNHHIWFQRPNRNLPPNQRCLRTFMDYLISKPFPFIILPYQYQY